MSKAFRVRNLKDMKNYVTLRYHYPVPSCLLKENQSQKEKSEKKRRKQTKKVFKKRIS